MIISKKKKIDDDDDNENVLTHQKEDMYIKCNLSINKKKIINIVCIIYTK